MARQIEIFELTNTWGVAWQTPGSDEIHYGFRELPPSAQLWLGIASGNAIQRIIDANLGTVIAEKRGTYGGQCRTVLVDVDALEATCRLYWERTNAREAAIDRSRCHYCGMKATREGFFGEPVCQGCST